MTNKRLFEQECGKFSSYLLGLSAPDSDLRKSSEWSGAYQTPYTVREVPAFLRRAQAFMRSFPEFSDEVRPRIAEIERLALLAHQDAMKEKQAKLDRIAARKASANLHRFGVKSGDPDALQASADTLSECLKTFRAEYVERHVRYKVASLQELRDGLKAAGMDINKFAPEPSKESEPNYYAREAMHARRCKVFRFFRAVGRQYGDTRVGAYIVEEYPTAEASVRRDAKLEANSSVDGYIAKLAGKIGSPVETATMRGCMWDGSVLTVQLKDGSEQRWSTQCIWNTSCLGKHFNQWPTRRIS